MMDKKDAIDYLLYMKHDVLANSPYDVALDTAIEALKATVKQPKTNGDRIRQMPDEELVGVLRCNCCAFHNMPECASIDCKEGHMIWLKQEVSEDATERTD